MQKVNVCYMKLSLDYKIADYNQNFINYFGLDSTQELIGRSLSEVVKGMDETNYYQLYDISDGDKKSLLVFRNHNLPEIQEPLVSVMYVSVQRSQDSIIMKMTNWLNWINLINNSLDNGYNLMANIDESKYKKNIDQLLETYWFKALSPLLMHIPSNFIGMIGSWAFFDILKLFNNKRGENRYSKDYHRDTISRIRSCLKKTTGTDIYETNVGQIIKDNTLINLNYNDELFIPHSVLKEDIVINSNSDILLENVFKLSVDEGIAS